MKTKRRASSSRFNAREERHGECASDRRGRVTCAALIEEVLEDERAAALHEYREREEIAAADAEQ